MVVEEDVEALLDTLVYCKRVVVGMVSENMWVVDHMLVLLELVLEFVEKVLMVLVFVNKLAEKEEVLLVLEQVGLAVVHM